MDILYKPRLTKQIIATQHMYLDNALFNVLGLPVFAVSNVKQSFYHDIIQDLFILRILLTYSFQFLSVFYSLLYMYYFVFGTSSIVNMGQLKEKILVLILGMSSVPVRVGRADIQSVNRLESLLCVVMFGVRTHSMCCHGHHHSHENWQFSRKAACCALFLHC